MMQITKILNNTEDNRKYHLWTPVRAIMQSFSERAHLSPGDPDELRALSQQVLVACETLLSNRLQDMAVLSTLGGVTSMKGHCASYILYFKQILFIFRQKVRDGEREGEKHQCEVASRSPLTGDLACNPGMCPHWVWD